MTDHEEESSEIQTFVFLDLETSGLDSMARILEISMIAVSRNDLINMKPIQTFHTSNDSSNSMKKSNPLPYPRVLQKYSRLYYPRRIILPIVEQITGLSNEKLHHLPPFNVNSASAIKTFLQLPAPVCLIAHNGNSFDFPILKAELLNVCPDSLKVVCADSLMFARQYEAGDIKLLTQIAKDKDFKDSDFFNINSYSNQQNSNSPPNNNLVNNGTSSQSDLFDDSNPSTSNGIFKTPEKLISHNLSQIGLKTPNKRPLAPESSKVTPEHATKAVKELNGARRKTNVKRALYSQEGPATKKQPFRQPCIYYRLFRREYDAHRAESDAMALMEICGCHGSEFARWADENVNDFDAVKPRWTRRKTFNL